MMVLRKRPFLTGWGSAPASAEATSTRLQGRETLVLDEAAPGQGPPRSRCGHASNMTGHAGRRGTQAGHPGEHMFVTIPRRQHRRHARPVSIRSEQKRVSSRGKDVSRPHRRISRACLSADFIGNDPQAPLPRSRPSLRLAADVNTGCERRTDPRESEQGCHASSGLPTDGHSRSGGSAPLSRRWGREHR